MSPVLIPAMDATTPTNDDCGTRSTSPAIKTGYANCYAYFKPALYQLGLIRDGVEEKIDLGFAGSRLLSRLMQEPGAVVSREELIVHAWPDRVVGQGSLNQQIYTLRQALGDEKNRAIIQTLPRRGYQLNPDSLLAPPSNAKTVDNDFEAEPAAGVVAPPELPPAILRQQRQSRVVLPTILSVIALGLFACIYLTQPWSSLRDRELRLGKLTISYMDADKQRLHHANSLVRRLEQLEQHAEKAVRLFLRTSDEVYEMLCVHPDGSTRSLMFHNGQLDQLTDEQLQRCMR